MSTNARQPTPDRDSDSAEPVRPFFCLFGVMAGLTSPTDIAPYGLDREARRSTTIATFGSTATGNVSSVHSWYYCRWRGLRQPEDYRRTGRLTTIFASEGVDVDSDAAHVARIAALAASLKSGAADCWDAEENLAGDVG